MFGRAKKEESRLGLRSGGGLKFKAEDGKIEMQVLDSAASVVSWKALHTSRSCLKAAATKASLMDLNATQFSDFELSFIFRMHIILLATNSFSRTFEISSLHNVLELLPQHRHPQNPGGSEESKTHDDPRCLLGNRTVQV